MEFLQKMMGGGQQQELTDFVKRYDQGAPWDGISHDEAVSRYQQVSEQLPRQDYEDAAEQSFSRLSPQERQEFFEFMRQRAQQQNASVPDVQQQSFNDPRELARVTGQMHEQQPNILTQLLQSAGGAGGSPVVKGALSGIAAMAAKKFMGGR